MELIRSLALNYVTTFGIAQDLPHIQRQVPLHNPVHSQTALAVWYKDAVSDPSNPEVKVAYKQLALEIAAQYGFLVSEGFTFEPSYHAVTYVTSSELHDAANNGKVRVYDFEHNNPMLSDKQNFMLRAVHDVFGHALAKSGFGPAGEYLAYLHHRLMLSPLAMLAMTTETHAQSSYFNYGPYADLPPGERPYAPQKAVIIPKNFIPGPRDILPR